MSHGDFAREIIKSAELIMGRQENYETLGVHLEDEIDELRKLMFAKVDCLDTSKGLVVFTDIIGGTPMNLAGELLERENVLVCSGLNLPVLLEISLNRDRSISELQEMIKEAYVNGMMMQTSETFGKEEEDDDLFL